MLGFCLARLTYLNIAGSAKSSFASGVTPYQWWAFKAGRYRIGITIHLVTIIPCGLLMVWQFVPKIRHKALMVHRINGYIVILLVTVGNAGAIMIADQAFGGSLATQTFVGALLIMTQVSVLLAWWNIKCLQIDQHRAWMLRLMFYLGIIITLRLIQIIQAQVFTSRFETLTCTELAIPYSGGANIENVNLTVLANKFPQCLNNPEGLVSIKADFRARKPENIETSLRMGFEMADWLALLLHAVGVEIYLALTPAEGERLRKVSYERQLERGWKNPGSAGLVAERLGDGVWTPARAMS